MSLKTIYILSVIAIPVAIFALTQYALVIFGA
jgi:hypothetical protein